jgi:hypothetical protein
VLTLSCTAAGGASNKSQSVAVSTPAAAGGGGGHSGGGSLDLMTIIGLGILISLAPGRRWRNS